jgi:WS/DGAT/MGAT family acyltransferase
MSQQPMSNADAGWFQMESPTNPMMIAGFFEFDRPMDYARLKATIEHQLLHFERFTQRVVKPRLSLHQHAWETDPNFELESHLHRIALPAPGDLAALKVVVNDLASTPLDLSRPLWQFHLIENYGEGCVLFCRLHHCIADGIALMHVLLSLCEDTADAPWPTPRPSKRRPSSPLVASLLSPARWAMSTTREMISGGADLLSHPARAVKMAQTTAGLGTSLARVTLMLPDSRTAFKGELSVARRTAWSQPLPLDAVKAVGRAMGATVNDVILASVAGALRRYLEGRGQVVEGIDVRAMVPVNIRSAEEALEKLGNHFGLVVLALPVGAAEPKDRLHELKRRMDTLKRTPEAYALYGVLQTIGMTPIEIERLVVNFFTSKTSAVMTNVAGPRHKLYLAGNPIKQVNFWVPQAAGIGLGISIFSYAGDVVLGVLTNARLVPDPETIVDAFETEFAALQALAAQQAHVPDLGPGAVSHNGHDQAAKEVGRCQALTKSGQPCKNASLPGSNTCRVHAGAA